MYAATIVPTFGRSGFERPRIIMSIRTQPYGAVHGIMLGEGDDAVLIKVSSKYPPQYYPPGKNDRAGIRDIRFLSVDKYTVEGRIYHSLSSPKLREDRFVCLRCQTYLASEPVRNNGIITIMHGRVVVQEEGKHAGKHSDQLITLNDGSGIQITYSNGLVYTATWYGKQLALL